MNFQGKPVGTRLMAEELMADYKLNKHGDVIMNTDNDANRRMVEQCYRTRKTMVNPIVDWTEEDVWRLLNEHNIPHCELYDEGFTRLGCIGCPLSGSRNMIRDFERWPKYRELYIRAFQRMIERHPGQIRILDPESDTKFKLSADAGTSSGPAGHLPQRGRLGGDIAELGQREPLTSAPATMALEKSGGGYDSIREGSLGEAMLARWLKVAMC